MVIFESLKIQTCGKSQGDKVNVNYERYYEVDRKCIRVSIQKERKDIPQKNIKNVIAVTSSHLEPTKLIYLKHNKEWVQRKRETMVCHWLLD